MPRKNPGTAPAAPPTANLLMIGPDKIDVTERLRPFDPDHAQKVAMSICEHGQQQPIQVVETGNGRYLLAAGRHRMEACKMLGIEVQAMVYPAGTDEDEITVVEILENLTRKELTNTERVEHWKRLIDIRTRNGRWGRNERAGCVKEVMQRLQIGYNTATQLVATAENISTEALQQIKHTERATGTTATLQTIRQISSIGDAAGQVRRASDKVGRQASARAPEETRDHASGALVDLLVGILTRDELKQVAGFLELGDKQETLRLLRLHLSAAA